MDFHHGLLGPRVPTLIVSPYASAGSQLVSSNGTVFDHTSIISTVRDVFASSNIGGPLTARDKAAPSIIPGLESSPDNNPVGTDAPKL